jgi:hypothetical protein
MKTHRIALERATTPVIKLKEGDAVRTNNAWLSEKPGCTTVRTRIFKSRKKPPGAVRPHQVEVDYVVFDYVVFDISVVDNNRKMHGRPYLTVGICPATSKIVGWHVGPEKPSWPTMARALRAIPPKKTLRSRRKKMTQLAWGAPGRVIVDDRSAFHSTSLVTESEQFQFELCRAPVSRATVERFFAQAARELREVRPGGTDKAVMTIEQLEQLVQGWVAHHDKSSSKLPTRPKKNSNEEGQP